MAVRREPARSGAMSTRFGPGVRLRSSREYAQVQRTGRRVATRYLTMLGLPNEAGRDRLGIVASRRLGGAVVRNRAKRRLRDIFRRQQPDGAPVRGQRPFDLVVIPRRELVDAPFTAVEADFLGALRRLRGTR
jgi:ribonuclease P protein component